MLPFPDDLQRYLTSSNFFWYFYQHAPESMFRKYLQSVYRTYPAIQYEPIEEFIERCLRHREIHRHRSRIAQTPDGAN